MNAHIQEIIRIIQDTIPLNNWSKIRFTASVVNSIVDFNAYYTISVTDSWTEFDIFDLDYVNQNSETNNALNYVLSFREEDYKQNPSRGAFYSLTLDIDRDNPYKLHIDYKNKPTFSIMTPDSFFMEDIRLFPRTKSNIPDWLQALLVNRG